MIKYPEHIQYIIDNYSDQLQARLAAESRKITVEDAMNVLLACDQSNGKKLVDWLVKTYIAEGFKWEDVEIGSESKLAEVLGLYQIHFNQIPRNQRNIYDYQSYGELYTLIEPYMVKEVEDTGLGSREIRRRERARALEESEVLYRSEDIIVAVPLTEEASKWWGRGTKWCTAADKNNYFYHYNKDAPLIVILINDYLSGINQPIDSSGINPGSDITKNGEVKKFQLWTSNSSTQFMDARDSSLSTETIESNWKFFKPFMEYAVEQNPLFLTSFPEKFRTYDLYCKAIMMDGMILELLPHEYQSTEIYMHAVKQIGLALDFVPHKYKTAELCRLAVEQNGRALRYVPDELRTLELCRIAINQNGNALTYIPLEFHTDELCRQAIEQNYRAISYIPKNIRYKFALQAVENSPKALIFLDYAKQDFEVYRAAIIKFPHSMQFIPTEYRTSELCKLAIEMNGLCLCYVPKQLLTSELCKLAVQGNVKALRYVPVELQSSEVKELAYLQLESIKIEDVYTDEIQLEVQQIKNWDQSVTVDLKQRLHSYFNIQSNELNADMDRRF